MSNKRVFMAAVIVSLGIVFSGMFLGQSLKRFRQEDRYINVKGLAEREVKADLAVWNIKTRVVSNSLEDASRQIEIAKNKAVKFLNDNGITDQEIILKGLTVNDKMAKEYTNYNGDGYRFIVKKEIEVRSNNVDALDKVSKMVDRLLQDGVVIDDENPYESQVKYYFTKLNDIKPDMLVEANKAARQAAIQFTKEQGVALGKLKQASQGVFSISDRRDDLSGGQYGLNFDIYKNVRVVIGVVYSIE